MRTPLRTALALLVVSLAATACAESPEAQAKAREAAMIAQAQADAAREQAFVKDSVALAATFTVDTVARSFTMQQNTTVTDENGDAKDTVVVLHVIQGSRGGFCNNMNPRLWSARQIGDTLTCQWAKRAEGVSMEEDQ